ncbi:hypothetical protein AVEN_64751-1 [Araneus ventricosus]|uniref:Uncharacterized protein n=1 Tax=Araneus ventricosus TaxID=182803 RepID=A0A4Y2I7S6_ARAVE|nr:hypothetical protein AVEN_64751-1 [Araneus ventricosus]
MKSYRIFFHKTTPQQINPTHTNPSSGIFPYAFQYTLTNNKSVSLPSPPPIYDFKTKATCTSSIPLPKTRRHSNQELIQCINLILCIILILGIMLILRISRAKTKAAEANIHGSNRVRELIQST